ncbi:hypothetical protein [Acidipila rosea]|uniref:Uncharacterized protein n=1 Tax=Acidipila rosea TaxID=768535 RepID=A0A4R1LFD7_9BACT|nr:hypothetical protein [Acidipila rosea]TCK75389.1 hypothetical protein C7378_0372 [Acidipila rosea]
MTTPGYRLRCSALAATVGWLTGVVATVPFQVLEVVRNTGTEPRLFLSALSIGLSAWSLFTFAGGAAAWIVIAVPVSVFFSGEWLLAHVRPAVVCSGLLGAMVAALPFRIWTVFDQMPSDMTNFWLYFVFTVSFGAATAWYYLRLLARVDAEARERYAQQR